MPPEIMKVENYDYKAEGLQEQNDKLEPRNTLVDSQTLKKGQSISNYLQGLDQKIQALEQGLKANNWVDEIQREEILKLKKRDKETRWILWNGIEREIDKNPEIERIVPFFGAGDPRREMINKNPAGSENNIEAIA